MENEAGGSGTGTAQSVGGSAERPAWLPQEFKSAEEMATAWKEMKSKPAGGEAPQAPASGEKPSLSLGTSAAGTAPAAGATGGDGPATPADWKGLTDADLRAASEEYAKSGQLSAETYKQLESKGAARAVVDRVIGTMSAVAKADAEKRDAKIIETVGGPEVLREAIKWANANLDDAERAAYDKAVTGADPATALLAVRGLVARMQENREPNYRNTQRGGSGGGSGGFTDESDITKAMMDPRYKTDPAYRREIEEKVKRGGVKMATL